MPNGINVGLNVDLGDVLAQFKGSLEQFRQNRTYSAKTYGDLLQKYGAAVVLIEKLKREIDERDREKTSNKLPPKEEIAEAKELLEMFGIKGDLTSPENIKKFKEFDGLFNK